MELFPVLFIIYVPNIANIGKNTGNNRTLFQFFIMFVFDMVYILSLLITYAKIANPTRTNDVLNVIKLVDNGCWYPNCRLTSLIIKPRNIKKERLMPTISNIFFTKLTVVYLNMCKIINPGRNVKVKKENNCLNMPIFNATVISVDNMNIT